MVWHADVLARERVLNRAFVVGVLLKGLQALIEFVCGVSLLFADNATIKRVVERVTMMELSAHPGDFIARYVLSMAQGLSLGTQQFYALYLAGHGLIKVLLVIGMLRNKIWSYPLALMALGLFVCYQLYRFSHSHSAGLLVLTLFDVVVIVLIYRQYRDIRGREVAA